ncbi:hypothetical protein O3P69_013839 [Scylla paramamosain]|uniref:Uncharacterized protein n=1 Tax=Scylla paramamosain TaxID=85552 RepID=A0AAW0SRU7_SCYPA
MRLWRNLVCQDADPKGSFKRRGGRMANLKMLVIGCLVSDELLAVLGINCPHLQVFDARDDIGDMNSVPGVKLLDYYPDLSPSKTGVFSDTVWLKRMLYQVLADKEVLDRFAQSESSESDSTPMLEQGCVSQLMLPGVGLEGNHGRVAGSPGWLAAGRRG